ncbi:MAG: thrombospondin type 3 repeat-containing protein [Pseudomonadota bacterium]|nr:thrombospondin type 3 repeat-containing protein [Pseudomonadota bacterium]
MQQNRDFTRGARRWLFAAAYAALASLSPSAMAQVANCGTFQSQTLLPISGDSVTATPTITSPCVGCAVLNPALAINSNVDDYATLTRGLGVFGGISLRVRNPATLYPASRAVGIVVEGPAELLSADLLAEIQVNTYLDGAARDTTTDFPGLLAPLLDLSALTLIPGESKRLLAFRANNSFNEIELRLPSTVTLLSELRMYAACVGPSSTTDIDNDGDPDNADNCPTVVNENQADTDGDGVGNACDNCPTAANANQANLDANFTGGDALGDACDTDDDADGDLDTADNCPRVANADQANADGDAFGNACDIPPLDGDGDGDPDSADNCPTVANANQADTDNDGIGDACDNAGNRSCGTSGAHQFRPLLLPDASTLAIIEQICALCTINDQDNAINPNPNDYATLLRPVGALTGTAALRVRSINTVFPAGREAALIIEDPADLLSADLLPQLQVNTYLGAALRQTNQVEVGVLPPLLDLDLLELFGEGGRKLLVFNTTQSFDGIELKLPSTVTALSEVRVYNACVEIPGIEPPEPQECPPVASPIPPGYCTLDDDGDGRVNELDNCRNIANANQIDSDGDGIGDACENSATTDNDGDGVPNGTDNCQTIRNANQADRDSDGIGNACDASPNGPDPDGDGRGSAIDNCPNVSNANQADSDDDGVGDACDDQNTPDGDNDGAADDVDNCPTVANASQADSDGDGIGDACDDQSNGPDGDGDGIPDTIDNCPTVASTNQTDTDGDGIGDVCDSTPGTGSGAQDLVPDGFQFSRQPGAPVSTQLTSEFVRITGINAPTVIAVSGGSYSIDDGEFTTAQGTIRSGELVRVRHVSSAAYATATMTTLTIGGVTGRFESVTANTPADDGGGALGGLWLLAAAALWRRRSALHLR